jgi:hypothetical protein
MEKSSKRGKIPQSDWPLIMVRYEAGETLASIARTYDCSPPAISYIVSRNRGKPANETPPPSAEPQLIKAPANGAAAAEPAVAPPSVSETWAAPQRELEREAPVAATASRELENGNLLHRNGAADRQAGPLPAATPRPAPANEPRPKLHLGFGNGSGNGVTTHAQAAAEPRPQQPYPQPGPRPMPQRDAGERSSQPPLPSAPRTVNPLGNGHNGRDFQEPRPAQPPRSDADTARKDTGALGQELRTRVDGDIAAFLAAFDAVLAADTQESRFGLREATDRLLRAGARTRIELERLEARVPLTPRDGGGGRPEPAWRYR